MTKANKRGWFRALLMSGVAACATPALAQQAGADEAVALEEIIVTAQRRSERLSEVPATISAFNGDTLRDANVQNLKGVANLVSSVQIFELVGEGNPVWIIRGAGIQDFNTNNTPVAAVYVDDIYQVASVFGGLSIFDVDRVEVLKGPQGGLYGRNTTGGAVQVVSRAPNLSKATGQAQLSIDNYERFIGDLSASLPLIEDKLAVRVAAHVEQSDQGWQKLVNYNDRRYGAMDVVAVRGTALYQPTDALSVKLSVDYGRDKSEIPMPRSLALYNPGNATSFPGFCAAILAGRQDESTCRTFAQATTGRGGDPRLQSDGSSERVLADPFSRNDTESLGGALNVSYDLGFATLTSISGYREFDWRQRQDADAVAGEFGHQLSNSSFRVLSQEFRLISKSDGPFTWLLGASYGYDKLKERRPFPSRDHTVFTQGLGLPSPLIFNLEYDQTTEAYAAFGRADYRFSDALGAFVELRYTDESKTYRNGKVGFIGFLDNVHNPALSADYELDAHWTGKVGATLKITPDNMLYGTISKGAKSGGFFGGYAFNPNAVRPYREEEVLAYEAGVKNTFLSGRAGLNASVFYYDYTDVQGFSTDFDPTLQTVATFLGNIGDAKHVGVELEGFLRPIENLRLGGSLAYLDAELENTRPFTTQDGKVVSRDGFKRDFAPEWSWTANVAYTVPLSTGELTFDANANGRTDLIRSFGSLADKAITAVGGYTLIDARVSYKPETQAWELSLWSKNLLDEKYKTLWGGDGDGSYFEVFGAPRTYGVQFSRFW